MITFKLMTEDDLEFFNDLRNSCAKEFLHDSRQFTIVEARNWFRHTENMYYIIRFDNDRIGYFRLAKHSQINKNIYVGADLHEDWRGQGLSFVAYEAFIPFLFEKYQLHKISLEVLATNKRAIRLYKKLGFTRDGKKREEVLKGNIYVDSIIMSLLDTEWKKRPVIL
jgi:RimJ/RimL family protein N-acetyltransferase